MGWTTQGNRQSPSLLHDLGAPAIVACAMRVSERLEPGAEPDQGIQLKQHATLGHDQMIGIFIVRGGALVP